MGFEYLWILLTVSAVLCSVGFYKYVYFLSIGYGFAVAGIGITLEVLTMYGTEDGVLNHDSLKKYASNLPKDGKTVVLGGGCHSYFGDYGNQNGDGIPKITRSEQIQQTVEAILNFTEAGL